MIAMSFHKVNGAQVAILNGQWSNRHASGCHIHDHNVNSFESEFSCEVISQLKVRILAIPQASNSKGRKNVDTFIIFCVN